MVIAKNQSRRPRGAKEIEVINSNTLAPSGRLPFIVFIMFIMMFIQSCGGGGGMPTPAPQTNVLEVGQTYDNNTLIQTKLYRAVNDTEALVDGSEFELQDGQAVNFTARAWAKLLQPNGTYREEEISEVPGVTFSWAFKGIDSSNAGREENLTTTLKQVSIGWDDVPAGGCYDLSVRAEISPADLLAYVNSRMPAPTTSGGGSDNDDGLWFAGGFIGGLLAFSAYAICPSDSAGVVMCREGEKVNPTPQYSLGWQTPAQATAGSNYNVVVTSDCPGGWTLTADGVVIATGTGNDTVGVIMKSADMHLRLTDHCGNVRTGTVKLVVIAAKLPPVVQLTADVYSGIAPQKVNFTATASDPDGTIVKYSWDLDGDGGFEDHTGTENRNYRVYQKGTYVVTVRATDNDGLTATDSVTVVITDQPVEVAYTLFIGGTKGPLNEGDIWEVDETGSQVLNVWELRGSDGSKISLTKGNADFTSVLPGWCW
ncbi:MAG: PKD domain-containing protein, partial [Patescibacteria group bacterium]